MTCDLTKNTAEGKVRPFVFVGPVNGIVVLSKLGEEPRQPNANGHDIYRLLNSIANQSSNQREASK